MFISRQRWQWPPSPGLLSEFLHTYLRDRSSWSLEDWKGYAAFLETQGAFLALQGAAVEASLWQERLKHSRKKGTADAPLFGLLHVPTRVRRGPKPKGQRYNVAREALAIRAQLESKGMRVSDMDALGEWFVRQGQRASRARANRNILNAMSQVRKRKAS